MKDRPEKSGSSGPLIGLILLGLSIWGGVIAWGVLRNQQVLDLRKPVFVLAVMTSFVLAWLALLWMRSRR